MNDALAFLGLAFVVAVVGGVVVAIVLRSRNVAPRTAADEFRQVMDALAPDSGPDSKRDGGAGSNPEPGAGLVPDSVRRVAADVSADDEVPRGS